MSKTPTPSESELPAATELSASSQDAPLPQAVATRPYHKRNSLLSQEDADWAWAPIEKRKFQQADYRFDIIVRKVLLAGLMSVKHAVALRCAVEWLNMRAKDARGSRHAFKKNVKTNNAIDLLAKDLIKLSANGEDE